MLKIPKGLKKKKKGKKSKRKEDELFTEEELEKYRKEHQQQETTNDGSVKQNEEWSKFKDLTTGIDSVLKKTQGDLDRIKETSFFQRKPVVQEVKREVREEKPEKPYVEVTEADFPHLAAAGTANATDDDHSEYGVTDDESEEDDQDDIFDTSYVDAVERGECKLAYVPDSPEEAQDDDIFDTSHVDAIIKGQEAEKKVAKGKNALDIGLAVGVLTGRIDNVTVTTTRRHKRVIPGDLLLEDTEDEPPFVKPPLVEEVEKSILDLDSDIPISEPIDLSVSLHTVFIQQQQQHKGSQDDLSKNNEQEKQQVEEEVDEFTLLAAESLEGSAVIKLETKEIVLEPVLQDSWSVFEADKNETVFAEGVVEDQIDVIDPYIDQDDPFDTSFADSVIPSKQIDSVNKEAVILEDDDDFDPRAEEVQVYLNNRRKSSVRIHLTNPYGARESITSDEIIDNEKNSSARDLLGGSTTDLTQLGDSPINPLDINETEIDPFDTTIADNIVAPGKVELKLIEEELIGGAQTQVFRVPSDPDFDPRADESPVKERRASRPENFTANKSVIFKVDDEIPTLDNKGKPIKPLTPYYSRELSITDSIKEEETESDDIVGNFPRTRSDENLAPKPSYQAKRRHSEHPQSSQSKFIIKPKDLLLEGGATEISTKVLTPGVPQNIKSTLSEIETDPFDTTFATNIAPCKTELKLLAKEFSCEGENEQPDLPAELLDTSDDIFQIKALTPEPSSVSQIPEEDYDPFDTSFASNLNPGRTELKLLESEFLN